MANVQSCDAQVVHPCSAYSTDKSAHYVAAFRLCNGTMH